MRIGFRQSNTLAFASLALSLLMMVSATNYVKADSPCADFRIGIPPKITIQVWALSAAVAKMEPSGKIYHKSNKYPLLPPQAPAEVPLYVWTRLLIEESVLNHLQQCGALPFEFRWQRPKNDADQEPAEETAIPEITYDDLRVGCGTGFSEKSCKLLDDLRSEARRPATRGAFTWRTWAHRTLPPGPGKWVVTLYYANNVEARCAAIGDMVLPDGNSACRMRYYATTRKANN